MRTAPFLRRLFVSILIGVSLYSAAYAHDPGLSTAEGRLDGDTLTLTIGLSAADARQVLDERAAPAATPLADDPRWSDIAGSWCVADIGGAKTRPTVSAIGAAPSDGVAFHLRFAVPPGVSVALQLTRLRQLPPNHREFVLITDGADQTLAQKFLTAQDPRVAVRLSANSTAPEPRATPTFASFFLLGVEHIWTGYDHLLFLFGLLIVCRRFRSIATIVSCFTVAHSLTLAAATLNLVVLPSRWVEPAIAASIAFVGIENLVRGGAEPRGRFVLTFAFGLIHGFGFASALRDLGVGNGAGGALVPLVSFNLGVEFGQIAVAAIALPIVWQLRRKDQFVRFGVPALSSLVAAAGLYWFAARTVFA